MIDDTAYWGLLFLNGSGLVIAFLGLASVIMAALVGLSKGRFIGLLNLELAGSYGSSLLMRLILTSRISLSRMSGLILRFDPVSLVGVSVVVGVAVAEVGVSVVGVRISCGGRCNISSISHISFSIGNSCSIVSDCIYYNKFYIVSHVYNINLSFSLSIIIILLASGFKVVEKGSEVIR